MKYFIYKNQSQNSVLRPSENLNIEMFPLGSGMEDHVIDT